MSNRSLVLIAALIGAAGIAAIMATRQGIVDIRTAAPAAPTPDAPSPAVSPPIATTPSDDARRAAQDEARPRAAESTTTPVPAPARRSAARQPNAADNARGRAAPELTVAVVLSEATHGDTSLNDVVGHGLDLARRHGPLRVIQRRPSRTADLAATFDDVAAESPALVIAVGATYAAAVSAASARHPELRVLLLDADLPGQTGVRSVTFRGDEGAFLAGVAAAAETRRGVVGMIGAMSTPALEAFECAWETGVRWGTREAFTLVRGIVLYLGTSPEAFARPADAEARSRELIEDRGVDVLVAAAGGAGAGVLEAARRARIKAIGIDTAGGERDVMIASIRRRADRIVETAIEDVRRGAFRGGTSVMSLANAGLEVSSSPTAAPVTRKLVEKARAGIDAGRMELCVKEEDRVPAWNFPPRPQG
jgi:basic membrane protein A